MGEINPDGESMSGMPDLMDHSELDKLNLKLWEKIDDKPLSEVSDADILSLVPGIFSSDFEIRNSTIARLNRLGALAAQKLVDILFKNPTDSTLAFQVSAALEEIGKRAVPPLIEALKKINDFKKPTDLTLLESITETLIRLNDKSAVPVLIDYINNINQELQKSVANGNQANGSAEAAGKKPSDFYQTVRLCIHDLLGDLGTREGLDDLLQLLGDGTKRVHVEVIETLRKVGDQRALVPLVRLYPVELTISELGARYIKLTFREIIRREKIAKQGAVFKNMTSEEKETLSKIYPNSRSHG
jgi:hypothetical protein